MGSDGWWAGLKAVFRVAILAAILGVGGSARASDSTAAGGRTHGQAGRPGTAASTRTTPAARDYVAEVRANFTHENRSYWLRRATLGFISPIYGIAIGLLLLFSGLSARIRDFAYARARGRFTRVLTYFILFMLVVFVLDFPLSWYQGFRLEHQYGLSNQGFGAWFGDEAKDLLVNIVFFGLIPLLGLAYLAIEKSPRRWWLWLGLGTIPVIVIGALIQPLVIDPLYNKFTPLRDQELKARILALAAKADIPGRKIYEVDKSKQTKKFNAYVSGFGPSQRIVLWDTTLEGMKQDEILFVMGHEMGHYKLAHIWKGIAFFSLLSFVLFFFCYLMTRGAVARFGGRWGFRELHDVASLPLLVMALDIASMIADPATNSYSRRIEHEADVFGVEVTELNDAAARAFIKLGSQNKSNPEPPALIRYLQYTHPPLIERIRFALGYRPWEEGRANRAFRPKG